MKRRKILISIGLCIIMLATIAYYILLGVAKTVSLNNKVNLLTRGNIFGQIGANVVVYKSRGESLVVDTQLTALGKSTKSKVDVITGGAVAAVVITHWHPDHSGGIFAFSDETSIISHENVRLRLSAPQEGIGLTKPGSFHSFHERATNGLPNHTIEDFLDLSVGSSAVSIVHYPNAHTDGDLVVFIHESHTVIVGDLLWPGSFPFVDVHNGGSVRGLEAALEKIIAATETGFQYVPGHGGVLTYDGIREYLNMVRESRHYIEAELANGRTPGEINTDGEPRQWEAWTSPLVPWSAWVEMIHASKTQSP